MFSRLIDGSPRTFILLALPSLTPDKDASCVALARASSQAFLLAVPSKVVLLLISKVSPETVIFGIFVAASTIDPIMLPFPIFLTLMVNACDAVCPCNYWVPFL